MGNIKRKDINEYNEYNSHGYSFIKVYADDKNHIYVFKEINTNHNHYEVLKGKAYIQPDGNKIYCRGCDEDWGQYGWTITGSDDYCKERIDKKISELTKC